MSADTWLLAYVVHPEGYTLGSGRVPAPVALEAALVGFLSELAEPVAALGGAIDSVYLWCGRPPLDELRARLTRMRASLAAGDPVEPLDALTAHPLCLATMLDASGPFLGAAAAGDL